MKFTKQDIEGFLIFLVIQPMIFFFGLFVFLYGVYQSIWG